MTTPMATTTVDCTNCGAPITITYDPTIDAGELSDALSWAICDACYRAEVTAAHRPSPAPNPDAPWADDRGEPAPL